MHRKRLFYFCLAILVLSLLFFRNLQLENERTVITVTDQDFQALVKHREQGLVGFHQNIDSTPCIPAQENSVFNWFHIDPTYKKQLVDKQEEMFRQGKISMIVMAGGEATRFGGPKPFVSVSDDLGEFLQIKVANFNWMRKTYGAHVPLYILSSEKRLHEFKKALAQRNHYGLHPEQVRWFVQGTVDTFIPSDEELRSHFQGEELHNYLAYTAALRHLNPDGIYRFQGQRRKVPGGHFDVIAAFITSGLFSEAIKQGIEFAVVVNIDNLQAILKNDGMVAYFAERGDDFGFLLAEKNLNIMIKDKTTGKVIQNKLMMRLREHILSFDGLQEFVGEAEQGSYKYVINPQNKSVDVYDLLTGRLLETEITIKSELGGTLVQLVNEQGEAMREPVLKEGFELPLYFNHADASFFNTNTIIVNLRHLLKFLEISQEALAKMNFQERAKIVREKLVKQIKLNFEFKNHEVEGEYPNFGVVKNKKTKILVVQMTRIILHAAHLKDAKVGYIFAPRTSIYAPIKEPEDREITAKKNQDSLKPFLL